MAAAISSGVVFGTPASANRTCVKPGVNQVFELRVNNVEGPTGVSKIDVAAKNGQIA